jgi:hypothetical protein
VPAVFIDRGFRFPFYSREGEPLEAVHIHSAKRGTGDAKLWLYPEVAIAYNRGIDARTEQWIIGVVTARRAGIEKAWNEHFGSGDQGRVR